MRCCSSDGTPIGEAAVTVYRQTLDGDRRRSGRRFGRRLAVGYGGSAQLIESARELVVGVNLLWCLPGEVGGSEEYLVRQLTGLNEAGRTSGQRCSSSPASPAAHRDLASQHEVVVASLDARRRSHRVWSEATWLPRRLHGLDVVHHGGGTVPRGPRDRSC